MTASLGRTWFDRLAVPAGGGIASLRVGPMSLAGEDALALAIVPDPSSRFPRARNGEAGLLEGWAVADRVDALIRSSVGGDRAPLVLIVDSPSQAYGYREELLGIHQALAASVDAVARARLAGHPVVALVVGKAISGAFLAFGLQANRLLALDSDEVAVQVMSKASSARITRRSVEELDRVAALIPATADDIRSFASLGAVDALLGVVDAWHPTDDEVARVRDALAAEVAGIRAAGTTELTGRLRSEAARRTRAASIEVRRRIDADWDG